MQLRISPVKAYLSREMDMMDDNDPFVVLTLGNQTQRTKTKLNEKVPVWDEEFVFKSEGNNVLDVKVMDEDQLVNEEIGNCQIDLRPLMQNQKNIEQYFQLKYGNIAAGKILLRIRFDGGQAQNKNLQNVRSYGEMKWYTPTEESITQYALHLQNLGNLGNMIGQQKQQPQQQQQRQQQLQQQRQQQQYPLQTQQIMLQSSPQQYYTNYQQNQLPQGYKGNLYQSVNQIYKPQSQTTPPQYQYQSDLMQPKIENRQPYQQHNFVSLNQPNSRSRYLEPTNQSGLTITQRSHRPVINERNYSYAPQPSIYGRY